MAEVVPLGGSALEVCRLELKESCAQEVAVFLLSCSLHVLKIGLDHGGILAIGAIGTDEPRDGREFGILVCDHLFDEDPR